MGVYDMEQNNKVIVFDLDDTLYDLCWPFQMAVEKYYAKCMGVQEIELIKHLVEEDFRDGSGKEAEARRAVSKIEEVFLASRKHSDDIFPDWTANRVTSDDMYAYRNQHAFLDFGIDLTRDEALEIQSYYKEFQAEISLTEDVKEMLTYLKEKGIKMGIISNGGGEHQWAKIRTLGLTEWIPEANIMISGEVGAAKPDAKIFDFARWKMKIPRDDAWYIGDTFENDIVGACNAGWHSVWVNRRGNAMPGEESVLGAAVVERGGAVPDKVVATEKEMCEFVRKLICGELMSNF